MCEELTEVVVKNSRSGGHAGERCIVTHRSQSFLTLCEHDEETISSVSAIKEDDEKRKRTIDERTKEEIELLKGVTGSEKSRIGRDSSIIEFDCENVASSDFFLHDLGKTKELGSDPVGERLTARSVVLEFLVIDDSTFDRVDEKHLSGHQSSFPSDLLRFDLNGTDFRGANHAVVVGGNPSAWS